MNNLFLQLVVGMRKGVSCRVGFTPHLTFLSKPPRSKPMPPHGAHPKLKNEAPHLKNTPTPLKREAPSHEMILRKSTINNNFKSS